MSDPVALVTRADEALGALAPRPFHVPVGRLAPVVAGGWSAMEPAEWVVAGLRERVGAVLRGCPVEALTLPSAGSAAHALAPTSGLPGARALHAVGLALGTGRPVLCFLGLASAAAGAWHEALNAAVLCGARAIFLVSADPLGPGAPVGPQLATPPAAIAAAFGAMGARVDAGFEAVREAVAAARDNPGPSLVEVDLGTAAT